MNKHEIHGGARYVGGKVEKAVGDAVGSRDWQVDGVVDQVAGGAENLFGRTQSIAADIADTTPHLIDTAREKAGEAADRSVDAARRGVDTVRDAVRGQDKAVIWASAAAIAGFALGWLVNGRRA